MTTVLACRSSKQFRLIDGLNGRTIPVDQHELAPKMRDLGRTQAQAAQVAAMVATRTGTIHAPWAGVTVVPNPFWVDKAETTQIAPATVGGAR